MSLFQSFTKTFKKTPSKAKAEKPVKSAKVAPVQVDEKKLEEIKLIVSSAEARAQEILAEAKADAVQLEKSTKDEMAELHLQYAELKSELEKRQRGVLIQESILAKKEHSAGKFKKLIEETQETIAGVEKDLLNNLLDKVKIEQEEAEQILMDKFHHDVDTEAQKELMYREEEVQEQAEIIAQKVLVQVMKHGSVNYSSEYTPPVIAFESAQDEQRILGRDQEVIRYIEQLTGVEITFDEEFHQIKLYCFNTIKREIARVLIERLRKGGQITPGKVQQLFQQTQRDLDREMFEAGKYLCNQLNIFNLPSKLIQILGMFKFRYSYGQNMIIHTLEEAKIGIALAKELGANSDVVRLGCLFHDIGKVIYDDDNNHVESGVKLLTEFKMPSSVIACVAESHEDIPFSSIESMIVHVADSISGARPGARFDDYEGFLKHQQGLIDISMSQKGVTEAFVINGGREIRITVNPQQVKDEELDALATVIRDQVQEFSTYPGAIVVNVSREYQHSELKD